MQVALSEALRWSERLIALSVMVSTLELLWVRRSLRDDGVFAWPLLRAEYAGWPRGLRALLDATLAYRPYCALLALELLLALALAARPWAFLAPLLLLATLLTALSFRGSYNVGSDALAIAILLGVSLARVGPESLPARAGLGYVAAQVTLSYAVAGFAKLRDPDWRSGRALVRLFALPSYAAPPRVSALLRSGSRARVAAWGVIAWECAFPLALVWRGWAAPWLACGLLFHLLNAQLLGLNRFFWTWLAGYPSLLFYAQSS